MLKQQNVNENTFVLFLEYNKNIKMSRATMDTLTAVYGKSASSLMFLRSNNDNVSLHSVHSLPFPISQSVLMLG